MTERHPLLIIGNGPSSDRPEVAHAMANADTVMRVNRFVAGKHVGRRCDIWGSSLDHQWKLPPVGISRVWWSAHPYCPAQNAYRYEDVVAAQPVTCERIARMELILELTDYFQPKTPSTGIILIAMALEAGHLPAIAGFDSFLGHERLHHYQDGKMAEEAHQWHAPWMEQAWIAERLLAGKLTTIP